jgi:phosphoglycolate phosphatase-like HAD superfamily hydrolase
MSKRLLITDLDNTLYDWVTFFTHSFIKMVTEISNLTGVAEDVLLSEFKLVHQKYGNSEQPYAALELPSVQSTFGTSDREVLLSKLDSAFYAFNKTRKDLLKPYEGVRETLQSLSAVGVVIVGHTEAIAVNGAWRLQRIDVARYFKRLYTLEGHAVPILPPGESPWLNLSPGFLKELPKSERKPNPALLRDICAREGFDVSDAVYVGDSITRDVSMAKEAGVTAIWAKYGSSYDRELWKYLVRITHWTAADVDREETLRSIYGSVTPDVTIESFTELTGLFDL